MTPNILPSYLRSMACFELNDSGLLGLVPSDIHGFGVFAKEEFAPGEVFYITRSYKVLPIPVYASIQRSPEEHVIGPPALRWLNHSCRPNAKVFFDGEFVGLLAIAAIEVGDEITCNYLLTEERIPLPFKCLCGHCQNHSIGG